MQQAAIAKWGNSLALRLPRGMAEDAKLYEGTPVKLRVEGGSIIITPARRKYRLADLLAGAKRKRRRKETDWGKPHGDEAW